MTKLKNIFVCQECGWNSPKWLGKCPECDKWNSFVEEAEQAEIAPSRKIFKFDEGMPDIGPMAFKDIDDQIIPRISSGILEFDRVLGGGLVKGSVVLVGGDPGIGKSTLMLQVSNNLSKIEPVLYISGEESVKQTKLRADRLGKMQGGLYIASETNLELIIGYIKKLKPKAVVIDSIQVLYKNDISSSAGSVSQIRECAAELVYLAKKTDAAIFLVGHVTKEGVLAGPRILEHMVDTVLYFEGETQLNFRILRAAKNRFGSTNEIGIFEMTENGLMELSNPSKLFLEERSKNTSGSAVTVSMEGTRPILVEIQSLVTESNFNIPKRQVSGLDYNRVSLIAAVLEKRLGLHLGKFDIFVNVAGGVKLTEPSSDLATALAIASNFKNKSINRSDVFVGELGLGGEVRSVNQLEARVREAAKMGFKRIIMPKNNIVSPALKKEIDLIGIGTLEEAISTALI